jgi:hypothetical protein
MLTLEPHTEENVVVGHASGTLTKEDYDDFRMRIEQMIRQHGSVRVLLDLTDFHGWDLQAAWEDLKLGLRYLNKFDRCAILGDQNWEKWMTMLGKPLFRVAYFDRSQREDAWRWLMQPVEHRAGARETIGNFVRRRPLLSLGIAGGLFLLLRQLRTSRS